MKQQEGNGISVINLQNNMLAKNYKQGFIKHNFGRKGSQ